MGERNEFPFLDSIIEEIWQGKRVVLVPPGALLFAVANVSTTIGIALWSASMLPRVLHTFVPQPGAAQLIGILAGLLQILVPALLIVRGNHAGRRVMGLLVSAWLAIAALSAGYCRLVGATPALVACLVALALFSFAGFLFRTRSYRVLCVFQQRMRARRGGRL